MITALNLTRYEFERDRMARDFIRAACEESLMGAVSDTTSKAVRDKIEAAVASVPWNFLRHPKARIITHIQDAVRSIAQEVE